MTGESALPGQRGVVAWVEGTRRGAHVRQVVSSGFAGIAPSQALFEALRGTDVEGSNEAPRDAMSARVDTSDRPSTTPSADAPALAPPRPCADLLLLGQRRNE